MNSDINKAEKLALLNRNVLGDQYIRQLNIAAFREILNFIENNILPFINDKSTSGQDLLNLFFVTFNKYVGKSDKNQAFTPDHITDFMAKITGVNKHSVVLDITVTDMIQSILQYSLVFKPFYSARPRRSYFFAHFQIR